MDLAEFHRRLSKEQQDATLAWLHEHGVRFCYQFEVTDGRLEADVYATGDNGQRYLTHPDGTRHGDAYGCFRDGQRSPDCPDGLDAAQQHLSIPLRSQPPVPV